MSTQLTIHNPNSSVLQRIGTPDERKYLIEIMAETIGIPAEDAERTDVIALLAAAAQRTMQFGWLPGVHMHVQKFETSKSSEARKKNPNLRPVYSYTLVDGEKAWKDSGNRWRVIYNVNWRYQRRPMTLAEVKEEARLQGFTEAIAPNSYGFWSRIIIDGQDDPKDADNPIWSAGVYFGKVKAGNFWRADIIPTGASSRDVALRRADKRAMMQSTLTLLPLDDLAPNIRLQQLTDTLRREGESKARMAQPIERPQLVDTEDDGDQLWASPNARPARPAARFDEEDFGMGEGLFHAEPDEEDDAPLEADARPLAPAARPETTPEAPAARPLNTADGPCPECHAPTGKLHATNCAIAKEGIGARPETPPAVAPEAPAARPEPLKAEPIASDHFLKIVAQADVAKAFDWETNEFIRKARNSDKDSAMQMSKTYLDGLIVMLRADLPTTDDEEVLWVLSMLVGYPVSHKNRPGQFVHSHIVKALRNADQSTLASLRAILELCRALVVAEIEGSGPNG